MSISHTLRSFHLRAQQLKKELQNNRLAWQHTEKEYFEFCGKNRYKSFESYKASHSDFILSLKKNHNTF